MLSQMYVPGSRISGKKTNHSLRATGATTLFNAQVPKKMIKDITAWTSFLKSIIFVRKAFFSTEASCVQDDGWKWIVIQGSAEDTV